MNRLTVEQLELLNKKVTASKGALLSRENRELLNEIAAVPYQMDKEWFYVYKTTVEKAAKLGSLIATRKPFVKGNRETAALAMLTLLDINGYRVADYVDDIDTLYGYLEEPEIENVCKWIRTHLVEERNIYPNLNI